MVMPYFCSNFNMGNILGSSFYFCKEQSNLKLLENQIFSETLPLLKKQKFKVLFRQCKFFTISFFLYFYYFNVITIAQKMIEILFPQLWLGLEIFPQIKEKLASFSEGLSAKEIFIELLFLIKFPWITSFSNWIGKIFLFVPNYNFLYHFKKTYMWPL